jgi:hypothetical protein
MGVSPPRCYRFTCDKIFLPPSRVLARWGSDMSTATMNWIQAISWLIASIGGVAALLNLGVQNWRASNQRKEEYRWKRAEQAKIITNQIWTNERCTDAMMMLDWTNRTYKISKDEEVRITTSDVTEALTTENLVFSEKQAYIRDCFDALLDAMQYLEHLIQIDLVDFFDVGFPMRYSIEELSGKRPEIDRYMDAYHFDEAEQFLNRFDFWKQKVNRSRKSCVLQPNPSQSTGPVLSNGTAPTPSVSSSSGTAPSAVATPVTS